MLHATLLIHINNVVTHRHSRVSPVPRLLPVVKAWNQLLLTEVLIRVELLVHEVLDQSVGTEALYITATVL